MPDAISAAVASSMAQLGRPPPARNRPLTTASCAPRGGRASAQRAAKLGGVALFGCVSESLDVTLPTASCARLCGGRGSARRRVNLGSMARLNRPSASLEKALPPTQSARGARALERQLQCMQRRCWGRPARRTPQTSSTDSLLTLLS